MITVGRQYRYIARRGKLAWRNGEIVTVLRCHPVQILIRFPDGSQAYTQRRFLAPLESRHHHTKRALPC